MNTLSLETRNYCKLIRLLDRSCISLRQLFKNRYSQYNDGLLWDGSSTCGQNIFMKFNRENKKKYKYAKNSIENGDCDQWDLSILFGLLLEINRPSTLSSEDIQKLDQEDEQINKLATIRKKIEHDSTKTMTDAEFSQIWNDLSQILLSFGDITSTELDKLKNDNIFNPHHQEINEENVDKAKQFNSEGTKAHQAEKYFEAIEQFTKAIDLSSISDVDRAVFYTNRSASRLKLYEQQLSSSKEKTELRIDLEDPRYNALQDAKKARELSLTFWKTHYRIGQAYASLDEHEKAINSFQIAFSLSPANETIKKALDESCSIHNRQLRQEHLDPRVSPGSISQLFNEAQRLLGTDIPRLRFQLSLLEKINPVAAAVFKGHQYRYGDEGINQDYVQAVKYYTKAAEQGNAEGIYNLAYLIDRGLGVEKDLVRAHQLYEQAAAQRSEPLEYGRRRNVGVAESEYELGLRYADGIIVHKYLPAAATWYQRAVDHEHDAAANKLAEMYENGVGVVQNRRKAEELYEIAARRGDPDAMYRLAELALAKGDLEMARNWYDRAVQAGNITAQANHSKFEVLHSKTMNLPNNIYNSLKTYDSVSREKDSTSTCQYDLNTLSKYAERGSETAKIMCSALKHFYLAMNFILLNENLTEDQENQFVHELAQCFYLSRTYCG